MERTIPRDGGSAPLHAGLTLNEIVSLHPEAVRPLATLGLDTCCGGALTVEEAAERHGLEPEVVLARLTAELGLDQAPGGEGK
jgi:iron-sulfur cluster repair protein YtfE (RIC family)